ncbi:MAG: penicillin-binding transpeptidase domain-containing protein, partial [Pseudomonadota bacterium]
AVSEFGERMGIYDELDPYLAMSLGAGETRIIDLAAGYATLVNGGKQITPTLLDRVQDRYGNTMFIHDPRECEGCVSETGWDGNEPPELPDLRPQVLDPIVAYQVVHMLEGVIERGTATQARRVGKPLAGKTGTTNDYKDALFFGFSPDLVVGIWVGFDEPSSLGEGEGGSAVAAPIFTDFMEAALEDQPGLPFRIPPGVRLVNIDARTGELPGPATDVVIMEAFRPGTEPGLAFAEDETFDIFGTGNSGILQIGLPSPPAGPETGGDDVAGDPAEFGFGPEGAVPAVQEPEEQVVAEELGDTW